MPAHPDTPSTSELITRIDDLEHSLALALALLFERHPAALDRLEDITVGINTPGQPLRTRKEMLRIARKVRTYQRVLGEQRNDLPGPPKRPKGQK